MSSGKRHSISKTRSRLRGVMWLGVCVLVVWGVASSLPVNPPKPRSLLTAVALDAAIGIYESPPWNHVLTVIRRSEAEIDPARRTIITADDDTLVVPVESIVLVDRDGDVDILPRRLPQTLLQELLLAAPTPAQSLADWAAAHPQAKAALDSIPKLAAFWAKQQRK